MTKMKTHTGDKKRFRIKKSGLIKRGQQGRRHILTKKSPKRKMGLRKGAYVSEQESKTITKMIQG